MRPQQGAAWLQLGCGSHAANPVLDELCRLVLRVRDRLGAEVMELAGETECQMACFGSSSNGYVRHVWPLARLSFCCTTLHR